MVIRDRTYTADEYYNLMAERDDDIRFELVEGHFVEIASPRYINSIIATLVAAYLALYVKEHDLGHVTGSDGGFELSIGNVRTPDAAFVAKERITGELPNLISGGPDLAVEVISPSETAWSISEKTRLYMDSGTKVVWIIYPDERYAEIRTPSEDGFHVVIIGMDGELTADAVFPDFKLPLRDVFPKESPKKEA